jgi:hypothetical protein
MFIDDSLTPKGYKHLNDPICDIEDTDTRIFRYQDNNDINRSNIPIWQILKNKDTVDYNNIDELRNSESCQIRKCITNHKVDHIGTIPLDIKKPDWIDI